MIRWTAIAAVAAAVSGCATAHPRPAPDIGVNDCPPGAANALLSVDALECWLPAPHGRWRILSHDSHFDVLVVQAEAADVRDGVDIARAFAANQTAFSEILIYMRERSPEGPRSRGSRAGAGVRIRRVRWTKTGPLEIFDFTAPA